MKVRSIQMLGFMVHEHAEVRLPERGLVVVRGPNGGGKSALIEAVATAFWGSSLRGGAGPWRAKLPGEAAVQTDAVLALRQQDRRGNKSLVWSRVAADGVADEPDVYDTTSKAQAALEAEVGTFDSWRRTHVFSSQDAAHFSLATDAERKALLEELLGLSVFDGALEACATELSDAVGKRDRTELVAQKAKVLHDACAAELRRMDFTELPPDPPAARPLAAKPRADVERRLREAKQARQEVAAPAEVEAPIEQAAEIAELEAAVDPEVDPALEEACKDAALTQSVALRALRLAQKGNCPECGQPSPVNVDAALAEHAVADDELEEANAALKARKQAVAEARHMRAKRLAALRQQAAEDQAARRAKARARQLELLKVADRAVEELGATLAADDEARRAVERFDHARAGWEARKTAADKARAAASNRWGDAEEQLADAEQQMEAQQAAVQHLRAVREVLGLRGARARVLGEALEGVEAVANVWMGRFFGPHARCTLSATSQLKSGKVVGAISLGVQGVGSGLGYQNLSGGERRRVDVALLMALAEVASHASGRHGGTVWFDEVFDALDQPGIDAVQRELAEMAQRRCVVVITHLDELARGLRADLELRAQGAPGGGFA